MTNNCSDFHRPSFITAAPLTLTNFTPSSTLCPQRYHLHFAPPLRRPLQMNISPSNQTPRSNPRQPPSFLSPLLSLITRLASRLTLAVLGALLGLSMWSNPKLHAASVGVGVSENVSSGEVDITRAAKLLGIGAAVVAGVKLLQLSRKSQDLEADVKRATEESDRLQKEEEERMRAKERRKLEGVGGYRETVEGEGILKDDLLSEGLKKRMEMLKNGEEEEDKRSMRYKPIPDRGMGSMLLDRPGDEEKEEKEEKEEDEVAASSANVEMLKRMWSLGDGDDSGSKRTGKDSAK